MMKTIGNNTREEKRKGNGAKQFGISPYLQLLPCAKIDMSAK